MEPTPRVNQKPIQTAGIRAMFLVWSHPQGSHRSQFFCENLGMELHYAYLISKKGFWAALFKYPLQAIQTIWILFKIKPQLVFVQDPPTFAPLIVWICQFILSFEFIIDTHTQRHCLVHFEILMPLRKFLAKRALTNIVTNTDLRDMITEWNAPAMVMEDPPLPMRHQVVSKSLDGEFNVVWVNTGSPDEPRDTFFEMARQLSHVTFYVTSDYSRNSELRHYQSLATENVHFTGHLPDDDFYQLLKSANVVLTLTAWNYTLQQGACEAMWLGRPVITSDWQVLRDYFEDGAIFVENTVESLSSAIIEMQAKTEQYAERISNVSELRHQDWDNQVSELMTLLNSTFKP